MSRHSHLLLPLEPPLQIHGGSVMKGIELFIAECADTIKHYPSLQMGFEEGIPFLSGELFLLDTFGNIYDTYSVKIKSSDKYPSLFPQVFEIGGRLPINQDWHIYESTGSCCIKAKPEELLICSKGITLAAFINEQVEPFFANQTFRRENGFYLKERSHGILGTIESLKELFKTKSIVSVAQNLEFILRQKEPGRTHLCFCGSGIKYRKCHRSTYRGISTSEMGIPFFYGMLKDINKLLDNVLKPKGVDKTVQAVALEIF